MLHNPAKGGGEGGVVNVGGRGESIFLRLNTHKILLIHSLSIFHIYSYIDWQYIIYSYIDWQYIVYLYLFASFVLSWKQYLRVLYYLKNNICEFCIILKTIFASFVLSWKQYLQVLHYLGNNICKFWLIICPVQHITSRRAAEVSEPLSALNAGIDARSLSGETVQSEL